MEKAYLSAAVYQLLADIDERDTLAILLEALRDASDNLLVNTAAHGVTSPQASGASTAVTAIARAISTVIDNRARAIQSEDN